MFLLLITVDSDAASVPRNEIDNLLGEVERNARSTLDAKLGFFPGEVAERPYRITRVEHDEG